MTRDIVLEEWYPHPVERVWKALTDPALVAEWLMENDFEARVGHTFTFRTSPAPGFDGTVHCEVLEVNALRTLSYSWSGGGAVGGAIRTVVTFTLEPRDGGTFVRLEHRGFTGARGLFVSTILKSGWKSKILAKHLPAVLETLVAKENAASSP